MGAITQTLGILCVDDHPLVRKGIAAIIAIETDMKLVAEAEKELSGKGRVLLRYSGTEPKIRLLIEGRELEMIDKQADRIAEAIQSAIGVN